MAINVVTIDCSAARDRQMVGGGAEIDVTRE